MPSRTTQRRRERKAALVALRGGCCSVCGYDRSLRALHFHHTDGSSKTRRPLSEGSGSSIFRANSLGDMKWPPTDVAFWDEFWDCELVCANCHMEEEERGVHGNTDWKSDIDPSIYAGLQAWHRRVEGSTPRRPAKPKRKAEVRHGKERGVSSGKRNA